MLVLLLRLVSVISLVFIIGCTVIVPGGAVDATGDQIDELAASIISLGPNVDPKEAQRAAQIAYDYTHELALAYEITDPPLIHNAKVNRGEKPRGLCWHWAEDMELRLLRENFKTLDMHRAIANAFNPWLIDHSTAIISKKGAEMDQGIVVDPWRFGGTLFWSPVLEDKKYEWIPRREVFARKLGYESYIEALAGTKP